MEEEHFGVWLGRQLRRAGMSQAEFAEQLGLTRAAVSAWVTGRAQPRPDLMPRIAELLATDVATVVTRDTDAGTTRPVRWHHRLAHQDGGREYGNAAAFAFDANLAVLAREATQNSLDERLDVTRPVRIRFTLHELSGEHLHSFLRALRWDDIEPHYDQAALSRQKVGRVVAEGLRSLRGLGDEEPSLLLLRIDDYNASGLTGPEYGDGRFAAVVRRQLDSHKSSDRAGGSYGLGKATLWAASRLGLVLINSTLSAAHEGRTVRRVVGRLDLPWRTVDDTAYAGPAWLGEPDTEKEHEGVSRSWWADERTVADLHLDRDGDDPGTSFLIVGAHDAAGNCTTLQEMQNALVTALADNFWAAMTAGRSTPALLEASVRVLHNGEAVLPERPVDPREHRPALTHALRAYLDGDTVEELTAADQVAAVRVNLDVPALRSDGRRVKGVTHEAVLLVTPADDSDEEHSRIVCMRGTRMTVTSRRPRNLGFGADPFQAVLLAGYATGEDDAAVHAAEAFLRAAEPPEHDRWGATDDLTATYANAPRKLSDFNTAMDAALRAIVGRRLERQESAGPEVLRNLLRLDLPAVAARRVDGHPAVERTRGRVDASGAWTLDVVVKLPPREDPWLLTPVVKFDVRSGGRPSLKWAELSAVENCRIVEGRILVDPEARTARFTGSTAVGSHPVAAALAGVIVEVQQAREVAQ
ncbi:helix-turn-helix transcriptional regulator [Kitasatospora purpeofusca]|uniref:helix-turn-helix transcriptional regulator n=1 Tax=Kitasatospora purpeofusca TaxID=67352 RepID=UPI00225375DE|nr:helix-turn-helix transcriptional regulator [Kitasatospora purpeofusca]MCX4756585.1 helix-turn-helix transcriptional regulator [Kitasatospora purpeofusca]WSR35618.1 helix-turn-helix transcriptional regulator [Kitasatospora purpeofusca]